MPSTDVSFEAVKRTPPATVTKRANVALEKGETSLSSADRGGARSGSERSATTPKVAVDVERQVGQLNDVIQDIRRELRFAVDDDSGRTIIKVIDSTTQEIVRQIPAEEVVALLEHLQLRDSSALLDTQA